MEVEFFYRDIIGRLQRIESKIDKLIASEVKMDEALAALQAQVAQNTSLEGSAIQLITGIAAQLQQFANDPAKVQALSKQLSDSATALSAAITANTPAPAPAPAP